MNKKIKNKVRNLLLNAMRKRLIIKSLMGILVFILFSLFLWIATANF